MTLDPGLYVRFVPGRDGVGEPPRGDARYGVLGRDSVHELDGSPLDGRPARTGATHGQGDVRLLAPCRPSKVLAVGRNFASHLHGRPAPTEPGLFAKLPTAIIGPGDPIVLPADAADVHFEGELVLVVGRTARHVEEREARDHILGVTAGNDVSERRWQKNDLQWLRAKGSDTFGPLGPAILVRRDLDDLLIETRVNGVTVQSERSSDLIFPLERILSFASRYITLHPGDVIYTGTPGNTSALAPGDRVEVEVEGVGTLANPVVAGPGS